MRRIEPLLRGLLLVALTADASTAAAVSRSYAFCKGKKAYAEKTYVTRVASADWICQLALEDPARPRCAAATLSMCEVGAGGDASAPGPHDVPRDAWFYAVATTAGAPVKCQCGCFAPDTRIATAGGTYTAAELLSVATSMPVAPLVRADALDTGAWRPGPELRGRHFTAGPETKPLVTIATDDGSRLSLTDNHPVFVQKPGGTALLRADELTVGDELLDGNGNPTKVVSLEASVLAESEPVVNFGSESKAPLDHIVLAEGLQVGDLAFQRLINAEEVRLAHRASSDWLYLHELGG
jgi:hypothetical protein